MNREEERIRFEKLDELKKIRFNIATTKELVFTLSVTCSLFVLSFWVFSSLAFYLITGISYFHFMCFFVLIAEMSLMIVLCIYEDKSKNKREKFLLKYGN